jgi:hypothetical protein
VAATARARARERERARKRRDECTNRRDVLCVYTWSLSIVRGTHVRPVEWCTGRGRAQFGPSDQRNKGAIYSHGVSGWRVHGGVVPCALRGAASAPFRGYRATPRPTPPLPARPLVPVPRFPFSPRWRPGGGASMLRVRPALGAGRASSELRGRSARLGLGHYLLKQQHHSRVTT